MLPNIYTPTSPSIRDERFTGPSFKIAKSNSEYHKPLLYVGEATTINEGSEYMDIDDGIETIKGTVREESRNFTDRIEESSKKQSARRNTVDEPLINSIDSKLINNPDERL